MTSSCLTRPGSASPLRSSTRPSSDALAAPASFIPSYVATASSSWPETSNAGARLPRPNALPGSRSTALRLAVAGCGGRGCRSPERSHGSCLPAVHPRASMARSSDAHASSASANSLLIAPTAALAAAASRAAMASSTRPTDCSSASPAPPMSAATSVLGAVIGAAGGAVGAWGSGTGLAVAGSAPRTVMTCCPGPG